MVRFNPEDFLNFFIQTDKLKNVNRSDYVTGNLRKENVAEHTWHLILLVVVCEQFSKDTPSFDCKRVIQMLAIHDLGEIRAGDTPITKSNEKLQNQEIERQCVFDLFGILSKGEQVQDAQYFKDLWEEFENGTSRDAIVARAFDRLQGALQNFVSEGKGWREFEASTCSIDDVLSPITSAGGWFAVMADYIKVEGSRNGYWAID